MVAHTRREAAVAATLLVLLVGVAFAGALHNGFVWDDRPLVRDNAALGSVQILRAFGSDMWTVADPLHAPDTYYRPVGMLSLALDRAIGGSEPTLFHLDNLILHALNAFLLWLLIRRRTSAVPAFLAGAWFAVLPANSEAVLWVSDRFDLLGMTFLLAALLVQRRFAGHFGSVLAAFFCLAALFTKETFAIAPVLVLAQAVLDRVPGDAPVSRRRLLGLGSLLVLATGGYFWCRHAARIAASAALIGRSGLELVFDYLTTLGNTLSLLAAPLPLTVTREYVPFAPAPAILAALVFVALCSLALWSRRNALSVIWLLLGCAIPALAVRSQGFFFERYVYVPAAGATWLLAAGLHGVAAAQLRPLLRRGVMAMVALVILFQVVSVRSRVPDWRDDRALFGAALAVQPASWYALFEMGHADAREGKWAEAADWYRRALKVNDRDSRLLSNAAAAFERTGDFDEAVRVGEAAVRAAPDNPRAHLNLAAALTHAKRVADARLEVAEALRLAPQYEKARALERLLSPSGSADLPPAFSPSPVESPLP